MAHVTKEPILRIAKRRNNAALSTSILSRVFAILGAALLSLIILSLVGGNDFGTIIKEIWSGSFSNSIKVHSFLKETCMLLLFAVALAPAFKMRFWNIGAQGQVLIGALMSAIILFYYGSKLPNGVSLLLMFVLSVLGGALWAVIPVLFRVKFGTNETLFTLMMNYVAIRIVAAFTNTWKGTKSSLGIISRSGGRLPIIFGNRNYWVYIVTIVAIVLMYVYLKYTKQGYEISVVGESVNTARYAGIDDKWVMVRTIIISGAICGVAGFLYVACINPTIATTTGGSYGFTAIIVAWLAKFDPVFMSLISGMLSFLTAGCKEIVNNNANLNESIGPIITSIFLFFILGSEFFVRFRLVFREDIRVWFGKKTTSVKAFFVKLFQKPQGGENK